MAYNPNNPNGQQIQTMSATSLPATSTATTNTTSAAPFSWSIEDLGALLNNPTPATGGIDMVQASAPTATKQFMNTPAYQLMYGNNQELDPFKRFAADPGTQLRYGNINTNLSPSQRFLSDEGTQLAIQQGMKPLLNNFASNGLAQSGALAKAMSDYQYNHYNDYMDKQQASYNTMNNTQGALFNNYQNQLQSLTGLGAANTGNQAALQNQQMLGQLLGSNNMNNAGALAQLLMNAGNNISSLYANQGTNGMGAMLNTGALQNTNNQQGFAAALQAYFAQQAGNAQGMGGMGAMQGSMGGGTF